MEKKDLRDLPLSQLTEEMKALGLPAFRAKQIYSWLHEKMVTSFDEMTNLPVSLREQLEEKYALVPLKIKKKLVSKLDGTVKYLYQCSDGNCIEAVRMKYKYGLSLCISTQVGCRMGCRFCASTLGGLVRNLTPAEMLEQVYATVRDGGERISSLVLMGIGEPLDNYENVLTFLRILSSPEGYQLGLRHVSLSTCGLVPEIRKLAQENLQLTLSISLHAPNNEIRSSTMPVNLRYPIEEVLSACKDYFQKTGRRISFEYALIEGVNDQPQHARELARLLEGMMCHVNLIPVNAVKERGFTRTSRPNIRRFQEELSRCGVNATVRRELGSDINAACGQLRRETAKEEGNV